MRKSVPDYEKYYSVEHLKGEMSSPIQQERLKIMASMCEGEILDVGAGIGELEEFLNKSKVMAVDIKSEFLNEMADKGIVVDKVDANSLHFSTESFDTVVLGEVLEHLENPGQALKEACRVAKKKVVFSLPIKIKDPWHLWDFNCQIVGPFLIGELKRVDDSGSS